MSDLTELAAAVSGDMVAPDDPLYDASRLTWNSRDDDARPAAVVRVAKAGDGRCHWGRAVRVSTGTSTNRR